jgi:enoyl-CoA hydratase/carnithine racemase
VSLGVCVTSVLPIHRDAFTGVVTLTLRPVPEGTPLVVLNRAMIREIDAALDEVLSGPAPKGFVLASDSRVFIAGADLKEIMGLSDPELHDYLRLGQRVFGRLATLPCTSVAAINGAALGGGLEIAMHCDRLIAAQPPAGTPEKPARPYAIGLPEAGLSICPGWGGTNLLPARMDAAKAIEMTATGRTMTVVDAQAAGLVEELVEPSRLLDRAREVAQSPKAGARSQPRCIADADRRELVRTGLAAARGAVKTGLASSAVLECVQVGLDRGWHAALDAEREHLVRLRGTAEGKAAIEAFFAKK